VHITDTADVGALSLPIAAGAPNAALTDPIVEALADFLGFMLRHDLDAKLAQLTGSSSTAVAQATHVFTFDPFHPRAHSVSRPLPSLYVWWKDQKSTFWQQSSLQRGRERDIAALYVFEEHPSTEATVRRRGLFAAVDAIFNRAADAGGHPDYSYNGSPLGAPLEHTIAPLQWDWSFIGGTGEMMRLGVDDPETSMRPRRDKRVSHQDFPCYVGLFHVRELNVPTSTGERLADSPAEIAEDGETVLERILEYGSGEPGP
jgi:hypothetical protein